MDGDRAQGAANRESGILIVEDEFLLAFDMQMLLTGAGHRVEALAESGEAALAAAARNLPELVLLDVQLPGAYDGIETARRLKAVHDVPVIFVTAGTDPATRRRAATVAPAAIIEKPFRPDDLLAAIAAVRRARPGKGRQAAGAAESARPL